VEINHNPLGDRERVATELYALAKQTTAAMGFGKELLWQGALNPKSFSETDLLRETAWVILCSGFREATVRRVFDYISLCFCDWESADVICRYQEHCRTAALLGFANSKKIDAIVQAAGLLSYVGFDHFKASVLANPVGTLQLFHYVGPVTSLHLAKNLGFPVAKPDRHLQRLAMTVGYDSAHQLCYDIARATGDSIQVIDIVLWRYCERLGVHSPRASLSSRA
jgi:hypothetical protein